ncbi:helix-turn-helix transcriptional regulator [Aedoeadaptatus coxii]|uniref:helix-turn-helix transcriptional regulator n=1 Tax=Aedoeadaptatus coxii TaxID=755172 RepID=UPI002AD2FA6C|nr:helix-turn-helix transcriptional regulator [Peptoniphilus coxii]
MSEDYKFTLKELRARKNKTQAEVAVDLGISVQTYNSWERDISGVAISKVQAVAEYFGCKISEIFFEQNMN